MRKKYDSKEADKRLKRRMTINWIIAAVSLVLIIFCYYYL